MSPGGWVRGALRTRWTTITAAAAAAAGTAAAGTAAAAAAAAMAVAAAGATRRRLACLMVARFSDCKVQGLKLFRVSRLLF